MGKKNKQNKQKKEVEKKVVETAPAKEGLKCLICFMV